MDRWYDRRPAGVNEHASQLTGKRTGFGTLFSSQGARSAARARLDLGQRQLMLAPVQNPSTLAETAGGSLLQAHEPAAAHLEDLPTQLLGGELGIRIGDDRAVQAHPSLLDQPSGLALGAGQTQPP